MGDREEARDLAQDAFVRAFHAMPRFRPGAPFLPRFPTILDRLCASRLRSARRHAALDEIPEPAADGRMDSLDRRPDPERGLAGLPEGQRRVVVMKRLEGLARREAAERLSIPPGAAMSRLHAAMRRLRRFLAGAPPRPAAPPPPRTGAAPPASPAPAELRNGGTRA